MELKHGNLSKMQNQNLRRWKWTFRGDRPDIQDQKKSYWRKNEYQKFCFRLYKIQTVKLVWPRGKDGPRKAPQEILEWCPPGKRRKGRSRNSGCRRLQQECESGELAIWNGSTERGGERKLIYIRHREM